MPILTLLPRLRLETKDRLRHNRVIRDWMSLAAALRAGGARHDAQALARSIAHLCEAARLAGSEDRRIKMERRISERIAALQGRNINWEPFTPLWRTDAIEKAVVLKRCVGPRERGVLLVLFEYQWARLMQLSNLEEFARSYTLVVAPTWSAPHSLPNCLFPALYPDSLVSLISDPDDLPILPRLSSRTRVVPLYCSSWVNPQWFQPKEFADKDIDIVMLANFATYKRHFALFQALAEMPRSTRVVLIGQSLNGRTAETLRREAALYGVQDRYRLYENTSDAVVFDMLTRAKISLILSLREGSCVAVVESIMADTPVGLYEDAAVGSRVFINAQTGRLLRRKGLARQLMEFIESADRFSPRAWALENRIDCFGSTEVLNQALKQHALERGEEWTEDIAAHHWRPNPTLIFEADRHRLQPAYDDIQLRFGFRIGAEPQAMARAAGKS